MSKHPIIDLDNDDFGAAGHSTGRYEIPSPRTSEELAALLRELVPAAIMGHSLSAKAVYYELRKLIGKDEMMTTGCKYAPGVYRYTQAKRLRRLGQGLCLSLQETEISSWERKTPLML